MKYLLLKFEGAKLFRTDGGTKDLIIDYSIDRLKSGSLRNCKTREPESDSNFEEAITPLQLSNVLHVLFGERPSPSKRKTSIPVIREYYDMAERSYIKIGTPKRHNKKLDRDDFLTEFVQTNKIPGLTSDSWRKDSLPTWDILKKICDHRGPEEFDWIVRRLSEVLGTDVSRITYLIDVIKLCSESSNEFFSKNGELHKRNAPVYYACTGSIAELTKIKNLTALTNVRGIDAIPVLRGDIVVPIENHQVDRMQKNGKGSATILDGGLVWIDRVVDETDMIESMLDGFTELSKINKNLKTT